MLSLEDRRVRGDMIATYKIMAGKDKIGPEVIFGMGGPVPNTRQAAGTHHIRVQPVRPKLDIRRNTFSQRVIPTWNSLPDSLKGAETVLQFKIGYDEWVRHGGLGA